MDGLNLILLGPPGAGKGTQAERLTAELGLPHLATGDLLRTQLKGGTELGAKAKEFMDRGVLVPDDVIIDMILGRIEGGDRAGADGFLLDGFPRNLEQAAALDEAFERLGRRLTAVLLIEVADEEIVRRISGRRVCAEAGHVHHVDFDPPMHDGVCDRDGSKLVQRDDDKPETVHRRLDVYRLQTAPLIPFYEERELLLRFDGGRTPTEVYEHIRATISTGLLSEIPVGE